MDEESAADRVSQGGAKCSRRRSSVRRLASARAGAGWKARSHLSTVPASSSLMVRLSLSPQGPLRCALHVARRRRRPACCWCVALCRSAQSRTHQQERGDCTAGRRSLSAATHLARRSRWETDGRGAGLERARDSREGAQSHSTRTSVHQQAKRQHQKNRRNR